MAQPNRPYGFQSLLTPDGYNPKLKKGRARGYSSAVMHLAPASLSGWNVCYRSSAGCRAACLNTAGRGGILRMGETTNAIQLARIARTRLFFENRAAFADLLQEGIATHVRRARAHGMIPAIRLNGTSDLPFERIRLFNGLTVFEAFPDVIFYDYTKVLARALRHARGLMPANYHLTFSRSESNEDEARQVLAAGGNVAAVFVKHLPGEYLGVPVLNGDADDLRFLDASPAIVGLKAKGRGKQDTSGFVVQPDPAGPAGRRILLPMIA